MLRMNNIHAVDKDLYLDFATDMPRVLLRSTFARSLARFADDPADKQTHGSRWSLKLDV